MRLVALLIALLPVAVMAADLTKSQRAEIEARVKPFSEVCLPDSDDCGGAATESVASGPRSGEDVYNGACMACHASGAAGAPKVGDVAAWSGRITKGMDALYAAGVNGVPGTGMIAKGGCMTCSDEEIYAAVDYMVDNSQ